MLTIYIYIYIQDQSNTREVKKIEVKITDGVSRLVFRFSFPPKSFNKPFEFLLYKTDR